ncbi:Folliculin-interacting protein 1 [Rhizophlyctis rosea]|nr:Folliculin-interacting protein 1 [Rhizophlyctis rosea]
MANLALERDRSGSHTWEKRMDVHPRHAPTIKVGERYDQAVKLTPAHNMDLYGEMIFGAVPLTSKGVTSKTHYFRTPNPQAMVTKLFTLSDESKEDEDEIFERLVAQTERRARSASISSFQSVWSDAQSDVSDHTSRPSSRIGSSYSRSMQGGGGSYFPYGRTRPVPVATSRDTASLSTSFASSISTLTDVAGSMQKRRKFERYNFNNRDGFVGSPSGSGAASPAPSVTNSMKKPRSGRVVYGVAVVFDLAGRPELRDFFFTHCILIDRHLARLLLRVEQIIASTLRRKSPGRPASIRSNTQTSEDASNSVTSDSFSVAYALQHDRLLAEEIESFRSAICYLYDAPRIQASEITFLSSLLTAVLTHHLAWTGTVASIVKDMNAKDGHDKLNSPTAGPYNPYLAQLSDLYGSIGTPMSACRTLILSHDRSDVCDKLLRVLTYFIRCGELVEHVQHMHMLEEEAKAESGDVSPGVAGYTAFPLPGTNVSRVIPHPAKDLIGSSSGQLSKTSYGRSLLAGWCDQYGPDFALMGLPRLPPSDHFRSDLEFQTEITQGEAVVVIGDTKTWRCKIIRYSGMGGMYGDREDDIQSSDVKGASSVGRMLKGLRGMLACGLPAATCVTYIEDKLQELYNKSILLSLTAAQDPSRRVENVATTLGFHASDVPLLVSVASTFDDRIHDQCYPPELQP